MVDYKIVGDFTELKDRQEPMLHFGESWELARGDGWVASIETCGEVRVYRNGERISASDIPQYYETDEALNKAEQSGEFEVDNNNWYELQFFAKGKNGLVYLDLTSDLVAFSFDECIEQFNNLMADRKWCEDLKAEVEKVRAEYEKI